MEIIYKIWYGSLLNTKTIYDNTKFLETVEVRWFKRVYNFPYQKDRYERATQQSKNSLTKEKFSLLKNQMIDL